MKKCVEFFFLFLAGGVWTGTGETSYFPAAVPWAKSSDVCSVCIPIPPHTLPILLKFTHKDTVEEDFEVLMAHERGLGDVLYLKISSSVRMICFFFS